MTGTTPAWMAIAAAALCACASKEVRQSVGRLEEKDAHLRKGHGELAQRLDRLADTVALLEDRVETLQLAAARGAERERGAPPAGPPAALAATGGRADAGPEFGEGEPFLMKGDPRERGLPTLKLTNADLERMDKASRPESPKPGRPEAVAEEEEPVGLYNQGYALLEREKYPEAISSLEAFLKKFPAHVYADNALFWIGEAYFRLRDYEKALRRFERVPREYPSGNKVPDALLRAGACQIRLDQEERARGTFAKILQTYPQSVAASKARTLMGELSKPKPKGRM